MFESAFYRNIIKHQSIINAYKYLKGRQQEGRGQALFSGAQSLIRDSIKLPISQTCPLRTFFPKHFFKLF